MKISYLVTLGFFCSGLAMAEQDLAPKFIQEQQGNFTRIKIEGSLTATQELDCISITDARPTFTPPDLHTAIVKCISIGNFDSAGELFLLSGIFSRFDSRRVVDRTAQGGGAVLIMRTFGQFNSEQRDAFGKATSPLFSDTPEKQIVCQKIKKIGYPTYFPKYLILHGLNAYTSKNPLENALIDEFNADSTWENLLDTYLHCPK